MIKVWLSRIFLATMLVSGLACLFIRPMSLGFALAIIFVSLLCHSCQTVFTWDKHQVEFLFWGGKKLLGQKLTTASICLVSKIIDAETFFESGLA